MALAALLPGPPAANGGGEVGRRFFPSTLAVEDPFVADELALPIVLYVKRPPSDGGPAIQEIRVAGEYSKRITPDLEVSVAGEWVRLDPDGGASLTGFNNMGLGVKYQFFASAPRETILSARVGLDIGGTGRTAVGADSFSTVEAALGFARGLGDLPEGLRWFRPFAVTGQVGAAIPTRATSPGNRNGGSGSEAEGNPNALIWGIVLEYSLAYLQSYVRALGLPPPVRGLIPVVEIEGTTPLDRGQAGRTTGTVNPGVFWVGKSFQVGVEAVIPINRRTGLHVGLRGGVSLYIDDLWPAIGRPLFGGARPD